VKDDRVYLVHIRDAIHDIEQYAAVGRDTFMGDRMRQDAVARKLETSARPSSICPSRRDSIVLTFPGDASLACATD
jgi:hypothetical protein